MNSPIHKIQRRINRKQANSWVFSAKDFLDLGGRAAVDQALSRLAKAGAIRRVARGLYDRPRQSALLQTTAPASLDAVVAAIARRDSALIVNDGALDANRLGLTTAVSARPIYWTNGASRTVKLESRIVQMKRMPTWLNYWVDRPASSVVNALRWLGHRQNADDIVLQLEGKLAPAVAKDLQQGMAHLPTWMHSAVRKIAKQQVRA
jgi:hypothetical protein